MATSPLEGKSILLIDDDRDIHTIYESFFKSEGITMHSAYDGESGIQAALEHQPSLIILDVMMPKMDGRQALQQLKANPSTKHIPVLMFSALISELERQSLVEAGAADYVEKSEVTDPSVLLDKIKTILN